MLRKHDLEIRVINLGSTDSLANLRKSWSHMPSFTCVPFSSRERIHSLSFMRFSKRSETFQIILTGQGLQNGPKPNLAQCLFLYNLYNFCNSQAKNRFYILKWLKNQKNSISWHLKINWQIYVHKWNFIGTQPHSFAYCPVSVLQSWTVGKRHKAEELIIVLFQVCPPCQR